MAKVMFSSGSRSWANNLNDLRERWHIRREEPIRFIVPVELFKEDVKKLNRQDLLNLKAELIKMQNKGKDALMNARINRRYENTRMEREEYADLYNTVNSIGAHIQEVNHALSAIKDNERQSVLTHFMDVIRERLSKDEWMDVMDEAHRRNGTGKGR